MLRDLKVYLWDLQRALATSVPSLKIQVDDWLLDLDTKPQP
jgi:hypothetical protein